MQRQKFSTVGDLHPGEQGTVLRLDCSGALRRRFIDMGITPGTVIRMKRAAPLGDPLEIHLRGYELSIRKAEAKQIVIQPEKE